jgi:MFS family permease
MRPHLTGLWRHPDFLKLWAGQTVSAFGSVVGGTALQFAAILSLHASPVDMALLGAANLAPAILTGLVAGAWIDRLRRRPLMIAADLGRAALLGTIPLAAVLGIFRIQQLFVVAFLTGLLALVFDVSYQSYLPTLVSRESLVEGNSKVSATGSISEVSGFGLAGWLVQLFSAPITILIDAASFVVSALSIWAIGATEPRPVPLGERQSLRVEISEGVRIVLGHPILRALAVSSAIQKVSHGMIGPLYLLYVNQELGFEPGVMGTIFGIGGITSLLGATFAARLTRRFGFGPVMIYTLIVASLSVMVVGLAHGVTLFSVVLLVVGQLFPDPAWTIYEINNVSIRQTVTSNRFLGRVNASTQFANLGMALVGTFFGGLVGQLIGVRITLVLGAGIVLVAAIWLAFTPVRKLKAIPEPVQMCPP